jgi:hypothetical protein
LLLYVRLTAKAGGDNQAVEILTRTYALASLDDTTTRLANFDELTVALARLNRWDDFARRVSDARRMAPNDQRWLLREIQRLLGTEQYDEAISAVSALPRDIDLTPLLPAWREALARTAVGTAEGNGWLSHRALLDAATTAGVDNSFIGRWRFEWPHFASHVTLSSYNSDVSKIAWSPNGALLLL